jgi:hypothetical protein
MMLRCRRSGRSHPCGEQFVAGRDDLGYERFFEEYDRFRYELDPGCLEQVSFGGRKVLEIGLGLGADSEQIIRRGGSGPGST